MNLKYYKIVFSIIVLVTMSMLSNVHAKQANEKVDYSIKVIDPAHHLAEVTALFPKTKSTTLDFVMPAWRLGKYKVLNLANGIRYFSVTDAKGHDILARKIDKNTWRVNLDKPSKLAVSYQLYANQLGARARHIDDTHAYLDGASSFIYSPEFMSLPLTVTVNVPEGWRSQSGMTRLGKHSFSADNYDVLASSPIETGIHEYYTFSADDRKYEVVIWGKGNFKGSKIVADYKKMVVEHGKMWGDYPFKRYLFIIHATKDASGATEHINSTVIQKDALSFGTKKDYQGFLSTSSHEFIHTWNVKAYRPQGIQDYDYTQENYSDLLWVSEGSTSYFTDILLVRSGLLSVDDYLKKLAKKVQVYQEKPGRKVMTAQQSSFDAWIEGGGDRGNNSSVNIYTKGNILSLLMDVELLKATAGENGYALVHKLLYQRFPVIEKGFSATDMQNIMEEISGENYNDFWAKYVESTASIEFTDLFLALGLKLSTEPMNKSDKENSKMSAKDLWTGIELSGNKITKVPTDSPAWKAGISSGDVLVAINGMKVEPKKFKVLLKSFDKDDEVKVTFFRRNILKDVNMQLTNYSPKELSLIHIDEATDLQKKMYKTWLGKDWPVKQEKK
ncbi:MAG: putative metalloprotease with PDZ domain [Enterobacterales bacterium]|jgi:predicted metalloprotease with PDZ domain